MLVVRDFDHQSEALMCKRTSQYYSRLGKYLYQCGSLSFCDLLPGACA